MEFIVFKINCVNVFVVIFSNFKIFIKSNIVTAKMVVNKVDKLLFPVLCNEIFNDVISEAIHAVKYF